MHKNAEIYVELEVYIRYFTRYSYHFFDNIISPNLCQQKKSDK